MKISTTMKLRIVSSLLFALLLTDRSNGLERKRREEAMECTVSATGEKVCESAFDQNGEKNGSMTDNINWEDDMEEEEYDDDAADDDDDFEEDIEDENCKDNHELCSFWSSLDECSKNPNYMLVNCAKSCNSCPKTMVKGFTSEQSSEVDSLLAANAKYGEKQEVGDRDREKTMFVIRKTVDYMQNYVHAENPTHQLSKAIINECRNHDHRCSYWAALGECEANPSYMVTKCAPACLSCHKIDFNNRCKKRDPNAKPGLLPGEMNLMFQRIVENAPGNATEVTQLAAKERKLLDDGTPIYTVTVHSRPETPTPMPGDEGLISFDKSKDKDEAPWVITFDNFLSEEECRHLIAMGHKNGYKRSTDVGTRLADGSYSQSKSQGRTSENAWCNNDCREDPIVQRVLQRLASVTGVPSENYEDLQLLRYEVGQFYNPHHDYIGHQRDRQPGPRILTFFLYLTDVEEGGGTRLNDLNIEIMPKMGRALLWPSVMNYDPSEKDPRTRHEARPVEKGTKFAANAWIHLYNNVEPHKLGCT